MLSLIFSIICAFIALWFVHEKNYLLTIFWLMIAYQNFNNYQYEKMMDKLDAIEKKLEEQND